MPAQIELLSCDVPEVNSPAFGALREQVLDAYVLDKPAQIPAACKSELFDWAEEIMEHAKGDAIGLKLAGIPDEMQAALRWAGVPLSLHGPLEWGRDIEAADIVCPSVDGDHLSLPHSDALSGMTSLAIRPIRHFIGKRFGIRLQAATAISCYLWSNQAVIVSRAIVRAGGFLHGPQVGQRASIAIEPCAAQYFSWVTEES